MLYLIDNYQFTTSNNIIAKNITCNEAKELAEKAIISINSMKNALIIASMLDMTIKVTKDRVKYDFGDILLFYCHSRWFLLDIKPYSEYCEEQIRCSLKDYID